ncbi:Thyroid receptor-interacting protein 11 [Bulinus truncatus]|nr:Thyroid receptor-interacting protein 11 [Bulinus truncatus]
MSWIGGSLSSLTGQLSNLTKDILNEGTEEVIDPTAELQVAKEKIQQQDSLLSSLKHENEHLRRLNKDLEEKAETLELQINAITSQYRNLLEDKEREINSLKQQHHELLEQHVRTGVSSHHGEYDQHWTTGDDFSSLTVLEARYGELIFIRLCLSKQLTTPIGPLANKITGCWQCHESGLTLSAALAMLANHRCGNVGLSYRCGNLGLSYRCGNIGLSYRCDIVGNSELLLVFLEYKKKNQIFN